MFVDFTPPDEYSSHLTQTVQSISCDCANEVQPLGSADPNTPEKNLKRKNTENPMEPPIYTTMALGEEGGETEPPGYEPEPPPSDTAVPTTMAIGEEGGELNPH